MLPREIVGLYERGARLVEATLLGVALFLRFGSGVRRWIGPGLVIVAGVGRSPRTSSTNRSASSRRMNVSTASPSAGRRCTAQL